ncbi:MAG: hypothetical protein K0R57_3930 [Paenibacillaceae bacterium]|nr:hypothetical protein [Paenibacillaceae bacterium]
MSRVNDIIENHDNLEQLFSIIKHYGVNAQFVTESLQKEFECRCGKGEEEQADLAYAKELVEDLKQFSARF